MGVRYGFLGRRERCRRATTGRTMEYPRWRGTLFHKPVWWRRDEVRVYHSDAAMCLKLKNIVDYHAGMDKQFRLKRTCGTPEVYSATGPPSKLLGWPRKGELMTGKRKQHTAAFKSQVALAAVKGDRTVNELAGQYGVHPTLIHGWVQLLAARKPCSPQGPRPAARPRITRRRCTSRSGGSRWNWSG